MEYRKNDIVEIEITDISHEGEGIGKLDGYPFFVKDTVIGDFVRVRVTKVKKHYAFGRPEEVLRASAFRITPPCPIYRQCGGCQIQAMQYEKQLEFKENKIRNNLMRIGGFTPELLSQVMEPIVGMEDPFRYRNKAQVPIGTDKEGNPIAGFYAGRTHSIIPMTDCLLGAEENRDILEMILKHMKKYRIPAYEETTGRGLIRHVLIRKGCAGKEWLVCLILNYKGGSGKKAQAEYIPAQEQLIRSLCRIPGMKSISVSINPENTNVIMGKEIHTLWGEEYIRDVIRMRDAERDFAPTGRELIFSISPLSFYQVNPLQTEKLYSLALSYAGLTGKETVWDLYCGIGTISLFLAERAGKVYGVEVIPEAIEDARTNAKLNGIENVEFLTGKAEEILPEFYERAEKDDAESRMRHPDVIVVDPPRKGCDSICLETMLKMMPERIVYVSCDSATLARDLKILCDGGYELKRVRGVDQFGMTVHVETVVLMSKVK